MPRRIYSGGESVWDRRRFVRTGAVRPPRAGEYYLSGAIPEVYRAPAGGLTTAAPIMREARPDEERCACCGQRLPDARS